MDKADMERFKELLLNLKKDIDRTIGTMKENGISIQSVSHPTELSNYDNHPAEMGTILYELEHNNALMVHQENMILEINNAIERIDKGIYGKCTFCGKEIGSGRLLAIPYTALCIECAAEKSKDTGIMAQKPPSEEEELDVKQYFHEYADDEFEGIDVINDLVKYGSSDGPQDIGKNRDMREYYSNKIDKQGIVDDMDQVSNDEYRRQLPD